MSFVRITEPTFWNFFIKDITSKIAKKKQDYFKTREEFLENTLLTFLMSSLNVELVHIILTVVSQKTTGTPKSLNNYKVY